MLKALHLQYPKPMPTVEDTRPRTMWAGLPRTMWAGLPRTMWAGLPRTCLLLEDLQNTHTSYMFPADIGSLRLVSLDLLIKLDVGLMPYCYV